MKAALIESRGDIFTASSLLGITAIRLHRAIQVSAVLRATLDAIPQLDPDAKSIDIDSAVQARLGVYRVVGLDALHDLATMPIDVNSAQNQVKLAAAARLAGTPEATGGDTSVADTLRALNEAYHVNAPRIRIVREKITVEMNGEKEIQAERLPVQSSAEG